jgi:hypothetical protein
VLQDHCTRGLSSLPYLGKIQIERDVFGHTKRKIAARESSHMRIGNCVCHEEKVA